MEFLRSLLGLALCLGIVLVPIIVLQWRKENAAIERARAAKHRREYKARLRKAADPKVASPKSRGAGAGTLATYTTTSLRGNYIVTRAPDHFLATKNGWLPLHRAVLFDFLGVGPHKCYWCNRDIEWHRAGRVDHDLPGIQVDHLDNDPRNNKLENLAAVCQWCNVGRSRGRFGAAAKLRSVEWKEAEVRRLRRGEFRRRKSR